MTLGNAIKLIRTARGVTQQKLAKKLRVSANYISLIEGDRRDPSLSFLKSLASELRVPIAMLFMYQGEPIPGVSRRTTDRLRDMLLELDRIIVQEKG
jgi:transcriptional regulator with XRE-family HTH domain